MSTKSHFIYEDGIEGYSETSEPRSIFGKWIGNDAYLIIDRKLLKGFRMVGQYLIIETKDTPFLPENISIWGDCIVDFEYDFIDEALWIHFEGGHYVTRNIIEKDWSVITLKENK